VTGARVCPDRLLGRLERQAPGDGPSVLDRFEVQVAAGRLEVTVHFDSPPEIEDLAKCLGKLDEGLFSYPDKALRSAERVLLAAVSRLGEEPTAGNVDFVCRALGALAAAYRVHARFGSAARCLRIGFRLCAAGGLSATRADLLLRTCYLLADHGEYHLAVELARQASDEHLMLKDEEGIGRALVVRAIMQDRLGQRAAAIKAYRLSLDYLPDDDWLRRYACLHGLGLICTRLGRLGEARRWVAEAAKVHKARGGPNWWRLVWLHGDIALAENDLESAARLLREARDGFLDLGNPFDVAIVSLRLAKVLFLAGRVEEMHELASEMMRLLKPLEKHKIAGGAVYEFTCAALAGRVTDKLLDSIYLEVEKDAPRIGAP